MGGDLQQPPWALCWELGSPTHSWAGRGPEQQTPTFSGDEKLLKARGRRANCAWLPEDVTNPCDQAMKFGTANLVLISLQWDSC